jgi:Family of unknown function (DUF5662)
MDSKKETLKHIKTVQNFLDCVINNIDQRSRNHDQSKLNSPEVEIFDEVTPKLAALTYGSPEYFDVLKEMIPALEHHYKYNSHHPEHYENGIKGMSLLDLIEMIVDWKAATLRHNDGNLLRSVEQNQKRFGYSDELKQIFLNTIIELGL